MVTTTARRRPMPATATSLPVTEAQHEAHCANAERDQKNRSRPCPFEAPSIEELAELSWFPVTRPATRDDLVQHAFNLLLKLIRFSEGHYCAGYAYEGWITLPPMKHGARWSFETLRHAVDAEARVRIGRRLNPDDTILIPGVHIMKHPVKVGRVVLKLTISITKADITPPATRGGAW